MTKKIPQPTAPATEPDWQAKANEYLAGWQRARADFDNYRKRIEATHVELANLAAAEALGPITTILDDFRRAFQSLPPAEAKSAWVIGFRQIEKRLRTTLSDRGLTPIEDEPVFDPKRHEAIASEPHADLPDGQIIETVELGWQLGDRVIKPAKVRVSQGQQSENGRQPPPGRGPAEAGKSE